MGAIEVVVTASPGRSKVGTSTRAMARGHAHRGGGNRSYATHRSSFKPKSIVAKGPAYTYTANLSNGKKYIGMAHSKITHRSSFKPKLTVAKGPAYTYTANLSNGKKYIGMAHSKTNLVQRISDQESGNAAASRICQQNRVVNISHVYKHKDVATAKKAETARYYACKELYGASNVRGAGQTRPF